MHGKRVAAEIEDPPPRPSPTPRSVFLLAIHLLASVTMTMVRSALCWGGSGTVITWRNSCLSKTGKYREYRSLFKWGQPPRDAASQTLIN
eukprot:2869653-Pleurochrysis_carterae.AAC.2